MAKQKEKAEAPPYVAFRTLWNFLDRLGEIGTPAVIDRSVWGDSLSGAYGSQLMAALRFLGLIDETGRAHDQLRLMAEDNDIRRNQLQARLLTAYAPILEGLDLQQATIQQLQDRFRERYGIGGETFKKAVSFFTHAAQAAGIPLSPYIERSMKRRSTTGKPRRKPRQTRKPAKSAVAQNEHTESPSDADANERIVTLRSGGELRLIVRYNPFKLSTEDREFVFGLIDMIQRYEGGEA